MKQVLLIILLLLFLHSLVPPLFAYSQISEYLCEIGVKFYKQGRFDEALHEFKKALIVQPDYAPALRYIEMVEQAQKPKGLPEELIPEKFESDALNTKEAVSGYLDVIEMQQEMIAHKKRIGTVAVAGVPEKKVVPPKILALDETFNEVRMPIEIEQGKSILIEGRHIQRFLVTVPDIVTVERKGTDELLMTGKNIGYTYVHIWDDNGRWTIEVLGIFPKPEGPSYEELLRKEEELARNFKLRYSLDWFSIEQGRRLNSLERLNYQWTHTFGLSGETPYGNLATSTTWRSIHSTTDMTYAGFSLSDGRIGPFQGFTLAGGDYNVPFSNLAFPGTSLRGVMLTSPAFHKKIEYTSFWGREGGGRFPNLSPELYKTKHSFLNGANISYSPWEKQTYKFSVVHGWGRDRQDFLNRNGYDLSANWIINKWKAGYEIAQDSERFAHLFTTSFSQPNVNFSAELRNIDRHYLNITGSGWSQGQLGGLFNFNIKPTEKLYISNRLNVYKDRLYPAEDNPNRWNEEYDWNAQYQVDPVTNLDSFYTLQNDLGRLSQNRYQSLGFGASKRIRFIKDLDTFARYAHQENKNFTAPSADYINERVNLGIRFNVIGSLYYYLNKELNWLNERYYGVHDRPQALENGVYWGGQIGASPFYGNMRFSYRDEENTTSNLSFLSGEDYIEGYTELTYRKDSNSEIYGSCRVRNSWAENPNVAKRIEASFNTGIRYAWNTGLRWDSMCNIAGYVFKDYNGDGLRQRDEPPVEGVKVWVGKDKFQVTDLFGYFRFKGIRGKKAFVSIDMSTVPSGYLLTVPANQEISVANNETINLYFGIVSRSEIRGVVFCDQNENGKFDKDEKPIQGALVRLENGQQTATDNYGRYAFLNASAGEHTVALDLNSIPIYYLPTTAISKKITLFEGISYIYDMPLKRIKEE